MEIKEFEKQGLKFVEVSNGVLDVKFCNLGASMYSIRFDNAEMIMTPVSEETYLNHANYHGKTVGRTGNRIPGNILTIDGVDYKLENNEGENTLHGGKNGVSSKIWDYKIVENAKAAKVIFTYTSKNKESGFPGTLKIKVTYLIKDNSGKIKCSYLAKTNKPTLCNLTNHAFFILGEKRSEEMKLKINASKYLLTNEADLLPIRAEDVTKELDFRKFRKIGKYLNSKKIRVGKANGFDHNFYLDEDGSKKAQVILKSDKRMVKIYTDFPCCQFYSENYSDDSKWVGLDDGTNRSVVLEPQDDYLVREVLRPGEKYSHFFMYEFKLVK